MSNGSIKEFDYIVLGAGSAGCVVARRLAEHATVLLVEAGAGGRHPHIDRPADYLRRFATADDWNFATTRQNPLSGRVVRLPRGRGPGGSTRINASIWMEPRLECLKSIEAVGGVSWSVAHLGRAVASVAAQVRPEPPRWLSGASRRFLAAATQAGYAPMLHGRMNRRGRRWTAADAWLADAPPTLTQLTSRSAARLRMRGSRAAGVEVAGDEGKANFTARRDVIVCCGAVQTPELLWRSGIGPRDQLSRLGIDCVVDVPGVGEGLEDHLIMPVIFGVPDDEMFPAAWSPRQLARWQAMGTGPVASNLAECGLFAGDATAPVQIHVTPTDYLRHPSATASAAMTIGVTLSRPRSRGRVWLEAADSHAPVRIDPGYLSDPRDAEAMVAAVGLARNIAHTDPLRGWLRGERTPGESKTTEEGMLRAVRRYAQTLYHLAGSCRMGSGADAVVDERLRVIGTENLRIVDASILPGVPRANPNALVMAIAWHAADRIPRSN